MDDSAVDQQPGPQHQEGMRLGMGLGVSHLGLLILATV